MQFTAKTDKLPISLPYLFFTITSQSSPISDGGFSKLTIFPPTTSVTVPLRPFVPVRGLNQVTEKEPSVLDRSRSEVGTYAKYTRYTSPSLARQYFSYPLCALPIKSFRFVISQMGRPLSLKKSMAILQ